MKLKDGAAVALVIAGFVLIVGADVLIVQVYAASAVATEEVSRACTVNV